MTQPHGGAREIWRDGLGHNPSKAEIRDYLTALEGYSTVSDLLASEEGARGEGAVWLAGQFRYREVAEGGVELVSGARLRPDPGESGHLASAWGAIYDGVSDVSIVVQAMIDAGEREIIIDAGRGDQIGWGTPVLVHDCAQLRVRVKNTSAHVIPLSSCLFDDARLSGLGLKDTEQYAGRQCMFMITEYDGENDRPDKAARDMSFGNITLDSSSTLWEGQISIVSSPHTAHVDMVRCVEWRSAYVWDAWEIQGTPGDASTWRTRHYDSEMRYCRSLQGKGVLNQEYSDASEASWGGAQILQERCYHENSKFGFRISGFPYCELRGIRGDQAEKGNYCLDVKKSTVDVFGFSYESRYGRGDAANGGGGIRARNSTLNLYGGALFIGYVAAAGDDAPSDGYPLSDYLLPNDEVFSIDNSVVSIFGTHMDAPRGDGTQLPIVVKNGSVLHWYVGKQGGLNDPTDLDVRDTSVAHVHRRDGKIVTVVGPDYVNNSLGAGGYVEHQGVIATGGDNVIANENAAFDADEITFRSNIRIALTIGAPEDYNLPSLAAGGSLFGVLDVASVGGYVRQTAYMDSGGVVRVFARIKTSVWRAWVEVS